MAQVKSDYLVEIKVIDGDVKMKIDGLTKGFVKLETGLKKLKNASDQASASTDKLGKKNLDLMSKAGLAGATLTEVGRTISDLPYGIRGIANNLSQLSTLFVTLISTTNGFKNAMKLLKMQLSGPLGVVLAFQVVIAVLDYFAGSSKKAKEETDKLTDSLDEQLTIIQETNEALKENNLTREQSVDLASGLLRTEKRLKAIIQDSTLTEKERDDAILKLLQTRQKEMELEDKIEKKRKEILETEKQLIQNASEIDTKTNEQTQSFVGLNQKLGELTILRDKGIELDDKQKIQLKELAELYRQQVPILDEFGKKIPIDKFSEFIDKVEDLKVSMDFSELDLDEGLMELNAFDMALNDRIAFMGQFLVETSEQRIDRLEKEALEYLRILDEELELVELNEKDKQKIRDYFDSLRQKKEGKFMDDLIASIQQVTSAFSAATQAAFEADMSIEERRTTMANNHLKQRLKNERLSASERERINQQIASNEESLQQKRDKIAERQFQNEKAAAISAALVNTYLAATDVLAREKLGVVGKTLAAAAVIGFGLAQVAAIARQQFVPSAIGGAGAGGAGGAGATIEAPDFNVVGASAQNQLAETVASAESQPVRAYVVGKDITTQQELDRNIKTTASFG